MLIHLVFDVFDDDRVPSTIWLFRVCKLTDCKVQCCVLQCIGDRNWRRRSVRWGALHFELRLELVTRSEGALLNLAMHTLPRCCDFIISYIVVCQSVIVDRDPI